MLRLYLLIGCLSATSHLLPTHAQPPRAAVDNEPVVTKQTTHVDWPASYKGRQLMVGSGGGFTGFSTTYCLLDNGQLFGRLGRDTTYQFLGKQSTAGTKRAFATVETRCRIKKVRFDSPGNTYKFVRWKKGKQQYNVTWGAVGATVPAVYPKFYTSFMSMIPAASRLK